MVVILIQFFCNLLDYLLPIFCLQGKELNILVTYVSQQDNFHYFIKNIVHFSSIQCRINSLYTLQKHGLCVFLDGKLGPTCHLHRIVGSTSTKVDVGFGRSTKVSFDKGQHSLFFILAKQKKMECPICYDSTPDMFTAPCKHQWCKSCLSKMDTHTCVLCRKPFRSAPKPKSKPILIPFNETDCCIS